MTAETPIATFFPATLFSKSRPKERAAQHPTAAAARKTLRKFCKFVLIAVPHAPVKLAFSQGPTASASDSSPRLRFSKF
jgi:hypothetical protein